MCELPSVDDITTFGLLCPPHLPVSSSLLLHGVIVLLLLLELRNSQARDLGLSSVHMVQ